MEGLSGPGRYSRTIRDVKDDPVKEGRERQEWTFVTETAEQERTPLRKGFALRRTGMIPCAVKGVLFPAGANPTRQLVTPAGSTWGGSWRKR